MHSGQRSPGPPGFLLLSAPSDQRSCLTVLTCRLSGVPKEAGWNAAQSQGQEENEWAEAKETVSSINKRRGLGHLSLLTQTRPHLLPGAAEATLQNCLTYTEPLQRPGCLFNMAVSGISASRAWKNGKPGGTRNPSSTISG